MYTLGILLRLMKCRIKTAIQYPLSYVIGILSQWFSYAANAFALWIMVQSFHTLNGWNAYEVMLLYGISLLSYAIGASFAFDVSRYMPRIASEGGLDELLTRPLHPLVNLIGSNFNSGYLSHFTLSLIIIVFSLWQLQVPMGIWQVIWFVICVLGASLIHCCAMLLMSFYSMRHLGQSPLRTLYWGLKDYTNYPISVFCKSSFIMQFLFTVILPYGFIAFYPSQYFLGKTDFMMFHPIVQFLTPVVGLSLLLLTTAIFSRLIKTYRSSGT